MLGLKQLLDELPIPEVGEARLYIWKPSGIVFLNRVWGHVALEFNRGGSLFLSPNSPVGDTLQGLAEQTDVGPSAPLVVTNGYIVTPNAVFYVDDALRVITEVDRLTYFNKPNSINNLLRKLKFRTDITHIEHHILGKQHIEIINAEVDYKGYVLLMANSPIGRQLQTLVQESGLASPLNQTVIFTPYAIYYVDTPDQNITEANKVANVNETALLIRDLVITIPSEGIGYHFVAIPDHAKRLLQYAPYPTCANGPVSYISFWPGKFDKTGMCPVSPHWYDKGTDLVIKNEMPDDNQSLKLLDLEEMYRKIVELRNDHDLRYKFFVDGRSELKDPHHNCASMVLNLLIAGGVEKYIDKSLFRRISDFFNKWNNCFFELYRFISEYSGLIIALIAGATILIFMLYVIISSIAIYFFEQKIHSNFLHVFFEIGAWIFLYMLIVFGVLAVCHKPIEGLKEMFSCKTWQLNILLIILTAPISIPFIITTIAAVIFIFASILTLIIPPLFIGFLVMLTLTIISYCIEKSMAIFKCSAEASVRISNFFGLNPDSTKIQTLLNAMEKINQSVHDENNSESIIAITNESSPMLENEKHAARYYSISDIESASKSLEPPYTSDDLQATIEEDDNHITISSDPNLAPIAEQTDNNTMRRSSHSPGLYSNTSVEREATFYTRNWCAIL